MRVLHIWPDYAPGLFDKTHEICLSADVQSHILCKNLISNVDLKKADLEYVQKISTTEISSNKIHWRIIRRARQFVAHIIFKRRFLKTAKVQKPDLIHFHFGHVAIELYNEILKLNTPFIISFYGVDASAGLRNKTHVDIYKILFKRAQLILVLCEEVRSRIQKVGAAANKISIWNLPAGIEQYPPRELVNTGTTRILIAARFVEKKGHVLLLEGFKKLTVEYKNVFLTMYGYGPSDWVRKIIDQLDLKSYCKLINNELTTNFIAEYNELLTSHNVFIMPSVSAKDGDDEGGPALTMVCAQSAGLPIISTNFPGAEVSMIDGQTGLLSREANAQSLYENMKKMHQDSKLRSKMGRFSSEYVHQEFSLKAQSQKILNFYRSAIGTK